MSLRDAQLFQRIKRHLALSLFIFFNSRIARVSLTRDKVAEFTRLISDLLARKRERYTGAKLVQYLTLNIKSLKYMRAHKAEVSFFFKLNKSQLTSLVRYNLRELFAFK